MQYEITCQQVTQRKDKSSYFEFTLSMDIKIHYVCTN